jgi:hypothetical protein
MRGSGGVGQTIAFCRLSWFREADRPQDSLYSSAQLAGCTKAWSSTGYAAIGQLSLRNSINRCTSRTVSWNSTLVSTILDDDLR